MNMFHQYMNLKQVLSVLSLILTVVQVGERDEYYYLYIDIIFLLGNKSMSDASQGYKIISALKLSIICL